MKHSASTAQKTKRTLFSVIALALVAVVLLSMVFVACGSKDDDKKKGAYTPQYQKETTNITPYYKKTDKGVVLPTSGTRHDVTVIEGGGRDAGELYGTWVDSHNASRLIFDGECRGIMVSDPKNVTFMYSAEDGLLRVDYDLDERADDIEYTYSISGDKLTMTHSGMTTVYTKE